jgi:hypothetical protein
MLVTHLTHGVGTIVNEWGPIEVFHGETTWNCASCAGIFDCVFGVKPHRFLHCYRSEYLQRVQ